MGAILKLDGSIERGNDQVNAAIIESLRCLHTAPAEHQIQASNRWKGLDTLAIDHTIALALMERMPKNKAIAFDLIGDDIFAVTRNTQGEPTGETKNKAEILSHLWNEETLNHKNFKMLLQGRLIPLNKKLPKTATVDDVRPIVVMSPLIKFMELRLAEKLSRYMRELHRSQVGFVPGMG